MVITRDDMVNLIGAWQSADVADPTIPGENGGADLRPVRW